jgi:phosphoribosylglycinamide formyltransferase-1
VTPARRTDPAFRAVLEAVEADLSSLDPRTMARGEPGLPRRFTWRGRTFEVVEVLETWRETGPCTSGGGERYVRRHGYEVRVASGERMRIVGERSGLRTPGRWWLRAWAGASTPRETGRGNEEGRGA